MPTYILGSTNADLSAGADFNKYLEGSTESSGSIAVSIAKGATETSCAYTRANNPSNADWETGAITVEIYVTTGNQYIYGSVQAHRINSSGTIQESSAATSEQNLINNNTLYTFNISSKDWTAGNASDRLRIDYIIRNARTQSAQSVTIRTGTSDTEVTTSIKITELCSGTIAGVANLPTTSKLSSGVKLVGAITGVSNLPTTSKLTFFVRVVGATACVSNLPTTSKLTFFVRVIGSSIDAVSSAAGVVEYYNYISGSTDSVSNLSAKLADNLVGSIDEVSYLAGTADYNSIAGLISGLSGTSSPFIIHAKFRGPFPFLAGGLTVLGATQISGTVYATTALSASLSNYQIIAGSIPVSSVLSAKLINVRKLAGTISAASGSSGVLSSIADLVSTISSVASVSGTSKSDVRIPSTVQATSIIGGSLSSGVVLGGTVTSVSELGSALKFYIKIVGSFGAISSLVSTLRSDVPVAGSLAGDGVLGAVAKIDHRIIGIADAQSSFISILKATSRVWGTSSITSDMLGALKATTLIRGLSSATSNVSTVFKSGVKLVGSFGITSDVSGIAHADTKLISVVSLQSNVTGIYRSDVKVASTASGEGSLSGVVKSTLRLPVTIAGTSTVSGTNKSDVKLIGSFAGASDVHAILIVLSQGLGGITYGKATLGASLTRYKRVAGTSASTASISGSIKYEVPIAGLISGDFNSTAVASEFVRIAGSSSGIAVPNAAVRYDVLVSGATAGDSSLSGTLFPVAGLAGISQSSSTVSALLRATATLVARSDTVSDVSGLEKVDAKLIGSFAGTSALSGTVVTTAQEGLEGTVSPSTTFSGILKATCPLAASSNADSAFAGSIRYIIPIAGSFAGSSSVSANILPIVKLVSTIAGQSSITGIAKADTKLISSSSEVSSLSGYFKSGVQLQSNVSDSLTIEALLFTSKDLISQVSESSSVSGSLYIITDLVGYIASDSNVSGSIKYDVLISSITSAILSFAADLKIYTLVDFIGSTGGVSVLGADLFPGVTVRGQTNPTLLAVGSLTVSITTYKQNYYLSNEISDLVAGHEFNNELHTVPSSSGTIIVSVPASETKVGYGFTDIEIPGNSDWEDGIVEVKLYVTAPNANIYAKVSVSRVSSSGMLLETSGYTTEKHLRHSGLYLFHVNRNWTAGSIGDRLRVSYSFRNIDSSAWQSITIRSENNDARITTTIKRYILLRGIVDPAAELSATCVAVALCSGTISGSLDISPRPSVITPIQGALGEAFSSIAALFVVRPMPIAGQTDVTSNVDSTLRKRFDIFGVLSNYSITDAYLRSDVDLVGSIDANAAFKKGIEGSITSDSTIAGILKGRSKLISTTAGDSIVSGYLRADVDLVGSIDVNAAFKKGVEGAANSVSSVSGTLKVAAGMIGLSTSNSSLTAIEHSTLRLKNVLIHAQTTIVGARPTGTIGVRGAVRGKSSVPDVGLRWYVKTTGHMHARSYVSGSTHADTKIIGQINAESTLDNDRIREWVKIVGTINVLSDSSASLKKIVKTAGNSSAITSASSSINRLRKIETLINVQTGTDGYIHSGVVLSGSSSPTSYASAYDLSIPEIIDILGSIDVISIVEGKKPKQRFTARRHLIHYSPPDHPFVHTIFENEAELPKCRRIT